MPPPPPGCDPNGYCPPPPQNSCPPGDAYCRPPPPPECGQKMEALRSQMEGLFRDFQASMEAFHQQFETARQQFSAQPHADSEWRAFGEKWRIQGEALGQGFRQKMESFVQSNGLGSCMPYMPPPPMGGGFGGGMSGGSEPPHMEYAKAPPQGNQFYNEDQQAREIRERCEAEVRAVIGAPPAGGGATIQGDPSSGGSSQYGAPQYNSGGSAPAPQGYSSGYAPMKMDPEKEAQVREIMKRCEAEIRSHYQDFYQKEGRPEGREDEFGSFNIFMDEADHKIVVTGKYLGLSGNPDTQMMLDVTCGGQKFLDSVRAKGFLEAFDFENTGEGTKLDIKAGGRSVLQLHDNPRCAINVRAGGAVPSIALDLADYLDVEKDENGYRFSDGEIDGKVLVNSGDASLESGGVLVVTGHATFLVSSGAAGSAGSSFSGDLNIKHALEKGKVGAEVLVALNGDKIKSDATPYADMEIGVEKKGDRGISATIDSASHDGKTVVMSFDGDIFSDLELDVQVFAVEGEEETAACVREASSLQDVLEPGDDEDCQEYWAVEDKAGVHLMVSFPHFSKKRVEIQSVGTSVGGPIPGFELVVLGLAVSAALVGVGVRLRKDS